MMPLKHIALLLAVPAAVFALGSGFGRVTAPGPKPAVPSNEQITIAASTLVHGLEVQNDYSLAAAPDFIACHPTKRPVGGLACDFRVSYFDETSATWELTLDRHNVPTTVKRLKDAPQRATTAPAA